MSTVPSNQGFGAELSSVLQPERLPVVYPLGVPKTLNYPRIPANGLLERAAGLIPNRVAAEFLGSSRTYSEVNEAANRFAAWLQSKGIQSGDRVAILLPNCPEYMIALNAIWKAGAIAVAVSPLSVAADVKQLLELTDCKTVVCLDFLNRLLDEATVNSTIWVSLRNYMPAWKQAGYLAALWQKSGRVRFPETDRETWFWSAVKHSSGNLIPVESLPKSDPAYILSTGGTTGNPKAVTLSHRNIVANAWQQMAWAGSTMGEEKMLAVLPFFHSYGMSTMLASGCALGATLIMKPRFDTRQAVEAIEVHRPSVFHAVPAMLAAMNKRLRKRPADLTSIKWVISGGAALPVETAQEFAQHSGAMVVEGYGLSEASPVTHVGPLDGGNVNGTIGLPLPDTQCRIVDLATGNSDVPAGEVGELIVKGPQVMLGYWKNPAATDSAIRNGWLHTGDLACQLTGGFYRIVDRKKDLIITSGFNVYPADVEQVLRECELVEDVAVVGVPDEERGELVKAFVVLKHGCRWDPAQLDRYCKSHLAAHRRPKVWEVVKDDLPRNFLGKVIRRELRTETTSSGANS